MADNITQWLEDIGFVQYAEAFVENGVDFDLLSEITNDDLKDLGVARLADRKRLLKAIVAFADGLLSKPPAWDIYLFYPRGARWAEAVPKPIEWMHQLGGGVAEMSRYRTEARLAAGMHAAMTELGFDAARPAPDGDQLARARATATARIGQAACGATAGGDGQCPRCAASGSIGQCSISGRYSEKQRGQVRTGGGSLRVASARERPRTEWQFGQPRRFSAFSSPHSSQIHMAGPL